MSNRGQELPRARAGRRDSYDVTPADPSFEPRLDRLLVVYERRVSAGANARRRVATTAGVDEMAARVSDIKRHTKPGDGPLAAIVAAAEDAMATWQEQEAAIIRCRQDLDAATDSAAESRRRLDVLIRVAELSAAPSLTRARPRRGLLGWLPSRRLARTREQLPHGGVFIAESGPIDHQPGTPAASGLTLPVSGELEHPPAVPNVPDVDIAVRLFGSFRLVCAGRAVDTRNGGKGIRVLKYLLAHHHQPVQKELLVELFWPDADLDTVSRCVHQTIYTVRRLLRQRGPDLDCILFANDAYLVNPTLSFWCDVDGFESAILEAKRAESDGRTADAVRAYSRAEQWYEGDYMADAPYEEWAPQERERLRLRYVEAANRLGDLHLHSGDVESAAETSRRVLHHEACDEEAHRRLIRCYGAMGQRNLVVHQYRSYVASAERLYGLGPSPETTALYESLIAD